jgi:energy-coupling factor transport system ATP-binding protein
LQVRELVTMWRSTRMVVLTAICAALYAALLIPFKVIPIIPGVTEVRPAIAIPILCSLLFGPAAAWGAGIGNLIGDCFGGIGPGSLFGFLGNFFYGLIPYKIWTGLGWRPPRFRKAGLRGGVLQTLKIGVACFLASGACALVIGWGIHLLGLPFKVLANVILANNTMVSLLLTPLLLLLLYSRVESMGLLYTQIMPAKRRRRVVPWIGLAVLGLAVLGGIGLGNLLSMDYVRIAPALKAAAGKGGVDLEMALSLLPAVLLLFLGVALLGSVRKGARYREVAAPAEEGVAIGEDAVAIGEEGVAIGEDAVAIAEEGVALAKEPAAPVGGVAIPAGAAAVRADRLSFSYRGQSGQALREIALAIGRGEYVAILGRSGSGRSTLCRAVNGLVPHFFPGDLRGQVLLFGEPVGQQRLSDLSRRVGTVFQDFEAQLFSTDVDLEVAFGPENYGIPREEIGRRVQEALEAVGLEHVRGRDPATLSGGEKQRLAIASILALGSEILVLDEPTTDLDPAGKERVLEVVGRLAGAGRTVLLVEQEAEWLRGTDRILLLSEGGVAADGPPTDILWETRLLEKHGVRPPPLNVLFRDMGLEEKPVGVEEAGEVLRRRGYELDGARVDAVRRREEAAQRYGEVLIDVMGLEFSYDGRRKALDGIDLAIREGEFLAIVGQNGSGKTTLAKHLNGLLKPGAGEVLYRGTSVVGRRMSELAREIGYVFQNPDQQIFCRTVAEEVAYGPANFGLTAGEAGTGIARALEAVNLAGKEAYDPFHLTKGDRQRVAVASVLSSSPGILILDEPTTGLDYSEQLQMMQLLRELNGAGHTVVVITHHLWVATHYAHRAVVMASGRICRDGPIREVFSDEEVLRDASLEAPEILRLARRLGHPLLTVAELRHCLAGGVP